MTDSMRATMLASAAKLRPGWVPGSQSASTPAATVPIAGRGDHQAPHRLKPPTSAGVPHQPSQGMVAAARHQHKGRSQAGFTLVEVLVVLSIIGLVVGLIGPRVVGYLTDAKISTARIQATTLSNAVELFFIDNGRYPLEQEGLQALVAAPSNLRTWNGPYLKGSAVPRDPWGRPYGYAVQNDGRGFVITIAGNDRQGGAEDSLAQRQLSSTRGNVTR
ncbi:type II secretion system major pseudopilin GspG [Bosea sp. LC85]|uniref:type II secretion system major pseudopilin GspG n=1 Tax=Bosea sp. LC85 TaxID=1502851 RepID=UPI001FCBFD13|nr:type II secretion system major pseudopilin GspG [Bosea sp. LC85]